MALTEAGISALAGVATTAASAGGTMLGSLVSQRYNERMWNKQNEYNSPAAQMQRFSDAGLNPNLIYGQGSSGNATTALHQDPLRFDFKPVSDSVAFANAMTNIEQQRAQTKKIEQETKNAELSGTIMARDALAAKLEQAVMENEGSQLTQSPWFAGIQSQILQNRLALQKLNFLDELNPLQITRQKIENTRGRIGAWRDMLDYSFQRQLNPLRLEKATLENQQTARNISLLNAKIGLLGEQTTNAQLQGFNLNSQRTLTRQKSKNEYKRGLILDKENNWYNTSKIGRFLGPLFKTFK